MKRLLCLLLLTSFQSASVNGGQAVHHYSAGGDVERPQTYEYSADVQVFTRDLLESAGFIQSPGSAVILRGTPRYVVSAEVVDPTLIDRGSPLSPGDIVVFRTHTGVSPQQTNALVILNAIPDVLPLTQGTCPLESLLQQVQLATSQKVPVTRTEAGAATTFLLDPTQSIRHGDVVDLSGLLPVGGSPRRELYDTLPLAGQTVQQDEAVSQSAEELTVAAEDQLLAGSLLPVGQSAPRMELKTESTVSSDHSDADPFQVASLEKTLDDSLPILAAEAVLPGDPTGSSVLNTIFVLGLVFAMGLIVVGWLRTRQDAEVEEQLAAGLRRSLDEATMQNLKTNADGDASFPATPEEFAVGTIELSALETDHGVAPSPDLSADEKPVAAQETVPADSLDAASDSAEVDDQFRQIMADSDRLTEQLAGQDPASSEVGLSKWFSGEWITPDSASVTTESAAALVTDTADTAEEDQSVESVAGDLDKDQVSLQQREGWPELDDLIENRLPMELKQVELPLSVSLFGRPAGPQRLRIDAAHSVIAPPHMALAARKKKNRRTSEAVTAARGRSADNLANSAARAEQKADLDFSRLDKALDFLEEHSDS